MLFRYIVSSVGPLSVVEKWLGITPIEFLGTKKWAMPTVLFYTVWTGLGYNMVLLSSSMSRIPTEILESAKIDGAGLAREMFSIVFPLVCGTISTLITLSIAHLFTNIGPVILLTNGQHETNTIASFIYFQVKSASENAYAYGSAIGLVFTIVGLPIVLGGRWLLGRIFESVEL
jgi:ABC-type sugar transport system permease subunit